MKISRNAKVILAVVISLMMILSACGTSSKTSNETSANTENSSESTVSTANTEIDPLGKYEPAIDLTVGRSTNSANKFVDGESFDNNIWVTEYKDALGINVKHDFVVDEAQYEAKVNVNIASGEIPDLMMVTTKQTKMLMESDLIYEMTDIFNKYASPMSKKVILGDEQSAAASKIEGKLMGIPMLWALDFQVPMVWVRSDWMSKLNLSEPKTADDLIKIAEAFKTQDPDGDGKANTYGIAIDKGLPNSSGGLGGFTGWLNMYHAYKGIWLKDASGSLVYSSIQPEMKAALQKMQDLYKSGIIDQEFAVKDGGKIAEDVVSEKVGMHIGLFWSPAWPLQDLKNKNPKSDWTPYPILSSDDKPAVSQASVKVDSFFVVSKKCKNPEAVVKLLNLWFEDAYGSRAEAWTKISQSDKYKDYQTFKYPVISMEPPSQNRDMYDQVQAAADGDTSKLTLVDAKTDYDACKEFLDKGNVKKWCNYKIRWDKKGGMAVDKSLIESNSFKYNEFFGIPGPVSVEKSTTMDKLENEIFTKIVMNAAPISEFDKFIEQWKKIGGDDLTKEVNDWYASK